MVFVLAMLITVAIIWFIVKRPKKKRFVQKPEVQEPREAIEPLPDVHVEPPQTVEKTTAEQDKPE